MKDPAAEKALEGFIGRYSPEVVALTRAALRKMRKRLPSAVQLVYDNYNALVIGFGPTDRASDAVFSISIYPRWVSLFFLNGAQLADPGALLKGSGTKVRHIVLRDVAVLDDSGVRALMREALDLAGTQLAGTERGRIVIKSISAKQRPRRPPSRPGRPNKRLNQTAAVRRSRAARKGRTTR